MFFREYSISFLMVCRLIDFAIMVLKLLMFKVCGLIGISKINFFNFSGTQRVKHYSKQKIKNHSKPPKLVSQSLFNNFNTFQIFFWFFTEALTLSLLVPRWADDNTDLPSNSNISKPVRVSIVF